jgi:small subunit ribosomal protein S6
MAKVVKATKKIKESKTKSVLTAAESQVDSSASKYELMFILSPMLTEDKRKKTLADFQAELDTHGAKIFHIDDWGKRDLAYRIRKFDEGYYMIYYFDLVNTQAIKEIDRYLRLEPGFIRHIVMKRESDHEIKDYTIEEPVDENAEPVRKFTKVKKAKPEVADSMKDA